MNTHSIEETGKLHHRLAHRYRHIIHRSDVQFSIVMSLIFFVMSIFVSFFAIRYATERASNSVTDIILSNIPALDVDILFVYGTILLIVFIVGLLLVHPKKIPFALNSLALFFVIRSAFISLTHIGPFPTTLIENDWGRIIGDFMFSSDLFFSAHTGVPFLFALIFWKDLLLRRIFLTWSVCMAVIVLLGHYHYSIDVASAYFITYTIYCMSEWLFEKDRLLFYSDV